MPVVHGRCADAATTFTPGAPAPAPAAPEPVAGHRRRPAGAARRRHAAPLCGQAVDRPVERHGVDAPAGVLAERGQRGDVQAGGDIAGRAAGPNVTARMFADEGVGVDVAAEQVGQRGVAHDVAAGDRGEDVGRPWAFSDTGIVTPGGAPAGVGAPARVQALEDVPPVVGAGPRPPARGA